MLGDKAAPIAQKCRISMIGGAKVRNGDHTLMWVGSGWPGLTALLSAFRPLTPIAAGIRLE